MRSESLVMNNQFVLLSILQDVKNKIQLIGINEEHCVSQWSLDFRPRFRRLCEIRDIVPNVPILALTATATERAREDIATVQSIQCSLHSNDNSKNKIIINSPIFETKNLYFV